MMYEVFSWNCSPALKFWYEYRQTKETTIKEKKEKKEQANNNNNNNEKHNKSPYQKRDPLVTMVTQVP
jgi:uncharacterized glyoxalase superfamily protein PhnB